jgi:hypothetical protein
MVSWSLIKKKVPDHPGLYIIIFLSNNASVRLLQIKKEVESISYGCFHQLCFDVVKIKLSFLPVAGTECKNKIFIITKAVLTLS